MTDLFYLLRITAAITATCVIAAWLITALPLHPLLTALLVAPAAWVLIDLVQP